MKIFKLPLTLFLCIGILFCVGACSEKLDYFSYVSEIRTNIFCAQNETACVTVYSGAKENPAIYDGIKNDTALLIGVKLILSEEPSVPVKVTVCYGDKSYEIPLEFHPVKRALAGKTNVTELPTDQIEVAVCYGETNFTLTATSQLNENVISYTDALKAATDDASEFLKQHTKNGVLQAEIVIRLLCEEGKNYYYVGFITSEGLKKAFLIDGASAEILARKDK